MKTKHLLILVFITAIFSVQAQYFGGNKPRYEEFDFKVYQTPHIELYSYLKKDSLRNVFQQESERWYERHYTMFHDTFSYKIPIILYNNHADFQQTTAISGTIGVGTGGVTEALKTRITMPIRPSFGQTKHVLGHEMVHAFQYNLVKSDDSLSFNNLGNTPLWMVEGMAEYLSLGRYDGHTAMWMRDAVLHNDFPEIKDLYKSKYFPYRYGQDFWAYIGGTYGDDVVKPLFLETLRWGLKKASDTLLHTPLDSLSKQWKISNEQYYKQFLKGRDSLALGKILFDKHNAGTMNVSPVISPDGTKMIFLSEKNVLSMDLYIADLETNKTRRIASKSMNKHIDAIDAYESAGTWSPDSKRFAYVIFKHGKNQLAIVNVDKSKVTTVLNIPDLQAFSYPAWSPDGKSILLLGQVDGITDLFLYHFDTKKTTQLTHDVYAEMQASWSNDGKKIVYTTDYYYLKKHIYPTKYHIGILDVASRKKYHPGILVGANNMNPQFNKKGDAIYFVSDFDGFRDLYSYYFESQKLIRMTRFFTGISGITKFSPAFTVNYTTNEIVYNYFINHEYQLIKNKISDFYHLEVTDRHIEIAPSILPPNINLNRSIVERLLRNKYENLDIAIAEKEYKPKFKLDYISNIGLGIGTNSMYGSSMTGGVSMIFSDILGQHQLYTAASLNGEIYDFAVMGAYMNQKHRIGWGGSLSHIPYRNYYQTIQSDQIEINGTTMAVDNYAIYTIRMFEEKFGLFSAYPFSKTLRAELGASLAHYSYRITSDNYYYQHYDPYYGGYGYLGYERKNIQSPDGFNFHEINTAFVGDNSVFGMTAPMKGQRFRIGVQKYFGKNDLSTFTFDYRKYIFLKPVTFAFKASHYNRFGHDAEKNYYNDGGILPPLYLGYDYFIRGYSYEAMYESAMIDPNSLGYNQLMGSKMLLANFEIRLPFTGPKRLAVIKSGMFFTDINFFIDAGLIWDSGDTLALEKDANNSVRYPIYSTGISTRINLFGQIILQPYYAFPLSLKTGSKGYFGMNFYPGF